MKKGGTAQRFCQSRSRTGSCNGCCKRSKSNRCKLFPAHLRLNGPICAEKLNSPCCSRSYAFAFCLPPSELPDAHRKSVRNATRLAFTWPNVPQNLNFPMEQPLSPLSLCLPLRPFVQHCLQLSVYHPKQHQWQNVKNFWSWQKLSVDLTMAAQSAPL